MLEEDEKLPLPRWGVNASVPSYLTGESVKFLELYVVL
jgi:hypothetical protein